MVKKSLKTLLLETLNQHDGWLPKGEIMTTLAESGYLPDTIGRELRDLAEHGKILADMYRSKKGIKLVRYARLNTPNPQTTGKYKVEIINGIAVAKAL